MKLVWLLVLLAGCSSRPPVLKPVTVEVPVAVPCRAEPVEKPDFALGHVSVNDDLAEKARAALVELHQRRAYEALLEAWAMACR